MTDKEFYEIYGRYPRRNTAQKRTVKVVKTKIYWNRIIVALLILIGIIWGITQLCSLIFGGKKDKETVNTNVKNTSVSDVEKTSNKESTEKNVFTFDVKNNITVCIDPGHGYDDVGTASADGKRLEKDDNLAISLVLQKKLENFGVKVVMTRTDDTNLSMADRCKIGNDSKADFLLCMHRNSYSGEETVNGVEIWVNNCKSEEDDVLANNIRNKLVDAGIANNRGVQYGFLNYPTTNYYINADTVMPSCLIELGFMTDDIDNTLFDEKKEQYAAGIAEAVVKSALQLNVIDEQGNRIYDGELLSGKKYINNKSTESDAGTNYYKDEYYTDSNIGDVTTMPQNSQYAEDENYQNQEENNIDENSTSSVSDYADNAVEYNGTE